MRKKLLVFITSILLLIAFSMPAGAISTSQSPYTTYTYSYANQDEQLSTQSYIASNLLYGEDLGTEALKNPNDIFVSNVNNCYYVSDTGNDRILTIGFDNKLTNELKSFNNDGAEDSLSAPSGICVDKNGYLFVADSGNNRLLKFDKAYKLVREYMRMREVFQRE